MASLLAIRIWQNKSIKHFPDVFWGGGIVTSIYFSVKPVAALFAVEVSLTVYVVFYQVKTFLAWVMLL